MSQPVYAVVVLHYISTDLTRRCVESLRSLDHGGAIVRIVVVDNASPNGSGAELKELYSGEDDVTIIQTEQNLGFSRANNLGFEHAVDRWDPDAVMILNNDIRIDQEDFFPLLGKSLRQEDAHVISPDVYASRTGAHQSPLREEVLDDDQVERQMQYWRSVVDGTEKTTLKYKLKTYAPVRMALEARSAWRRSKKNRRSHIARTGIVPSGAALIFTRDFIETREAPFTPATFLYFEEDILALRCERNGWKIVYDPTLQVVHLHEGATKEIVSTEEEKRLFIAKHYLDSLTILKRFRDQDSAYDAECVSQARGQR